MNKSVFLIMSVFISACVSSPADQSSFAYKNVNIKWLGHAGFELTGSKKIYVDPFKINFTDKADLILLTHEHFDHCDPESIKKLQGKNTQIFGTFNCITQFSGRTNTLRPGEDMRYPDGIVIASVNAYNINKSYHPKGFGRGFVITIDNVTIYHAGDTDFIPEMPKGMDIALLPIGGKYTMNATEAADAAKQINPIIVVPMHYNSDAFGISGINADPTQLAKLLEGIDIDVKILSASAQ